MQPVQVVAMNRGMYLLLFMPISPRANTYHGSPAPSHSASAANQYLFTRHGCTFEKPCYERTLTALFAFGFTALYLGQQSHVYRFQLIKHPKSNHKDALTSPWYKTSKLDVHDAKQMLLIEI